jgi:hypothetical protein
VGGGGSCSTHESRSCGRADQVEPGPGRRAEDEARNGVGKGQGPASLLRRLERKEGGRAASDGQRDVLILRQSGGGPVRAPYPMWAVAASACGLAV